MGLIMKKALCYSLVLSTSLLFGCASSPNIAYNYSGNTVTYNTPSNGQINTAYVGDSILRQDIYKEVEALNIQSPVKYGLYHFPSGNYEKIGNDDKYDFFEPLSTEETGAALNQEGNARIYVQAIAVEKGSNAQICPIHAISGMACLNANFNVEKTKSKKEASFEQTLIYNGTAGSKINVGYRELANDKARPTFNNNVEYDLSKSKSISYKGAKIEVIEANNSSITYKVTSPFNSN
ncbi:hypothetical protein DMW08_23805 [Vibrio parahaemolyticus]|nr:hypothetical protein [Vibrio parahaemolyticus]EGR2987422.1 hypothetical protein [Vibrio parahaemolyticus]